MTETTGTAGTLTSPLLAARLDRLPVSRFHYRLLIAGGLGFTFDAMDGAVVAFILPAVTKEWDLSSGATGILASSLLIGYLFGALAAGILGDRIGRRAVMLNFLAVYSVASVVAAIAPNFAVLFIARVVAGIGTGAESAITAPYLSEFVPSRVRGRYIGSLTGFFAFGYVFASLLGYFMVSGVPDGWRWVQVITALPIVMLLWWRRMLPESPRFLHAHGRTAEAEKVLTSIEEQVSAQTGRPLPPVRRSDVVDDVHVSSGRVIDNLTALLSKGLRRTTITAWVYWFVAIFTYYGFFTWIPSLLVNQGFDISKSFLFSIVIYLAQIPGYYSAAFVSEWMERKWTIAIYLAGGAVGALGLLSQTGGHGDQRPRGRDVHDHHYAIPSLNRVCDGVPDVRRAARDEIRRGAHHLKIMLSGGCASPTDRIDSIQFSDEEVSAIVGEAAAANLYCAGHAYTAAAVNRGLRLGVRTIEHGNLLDHTSIELFLRHDAFYVPTLVTYEALLAQSRELGFTEEQYAKVVQVTENGFRALELADKAGVKIAYGTDLLGAMQTRQSEEFTLRAKVQSPGAVLRSATTVAAELLRREGELGVLAPGAVGDVVLTRANPLRDMDVLAKPESGIVAVIQEGTVRARR